MTEAGHKTIARVEKSICACPGCQREVVTIVLANLVTVVPVSSRAAELLDPSVLVWRDRLRRELPSDAIGLLCQDNSLAETCGGHGRSTASRATANYEDVYFSIS